VETLVRNPASAVLRQLMVAAVLVLVASRPLAAGPLAGNAWLTPALAIGAPRSHAQPPFARPGSDGP